MDFLRSRQNININVQLNRSDKKVIGTAIKKVFGTKNERVIKKIHPVVDEINSLEEATKKLTDNELKAKTGEFKQRIDNGEPLDELLPEAFAVVRDVGR